MKCQIEQQLLLISVKRVFTVKCYKETQKHVQVEVQLNDAMFITAKLNKAKKHFNNDLKRVIKAVNDWQRTIK
jgi:hypothetical protein